MKPIFGRDIVFFSTTLSKSKLMTFHEILIGFMTVQTRSRLEELGIGNLFAHHFFPTNKSRNITCRFFLMVFFKHRSRFKPQGDEMNIHLPQTEEARAEASLGRSLIWIC